MDYWSGELKRRVIIVGVMFCVLSLATLASAQNAFLSASPDLGAYGYLPEPEPVLAVPVAPPRMAPELALNCYQGSVSLQSETLAEYSADTVIEADLPDTKQRGEFELTRHYAAPNTLKFKAVQFTGDSFVKSNVITRLLQAEVDHVERGESSQTAIDQANYRFSYRGVDKLNGQPVHVFNVKPRQSRPGLFKGKIYVDVFTGHLRRAEGSVKSPSFFIKKIDFVQDYADFGEYTFPVHLRSVAKTRLVGQVNVDVTIRNYQAQSMSPDVAAHLHTMALPRTQ